MKCSNKLLIKYKIAKNISDEVKKFSDDATQYFLSVAKEINKEGNKEELNEDMLRVRKKSFNHR